MEPSRRSPLRILAPAALAVFALAVVIILAGGNGGSGGTAADRVQKARDLGPTTATGSTATRRHRSSGGSGALPQSVYVVQNGDTLGAIAQKVGISVSKLQDLNPGLDQFSLVAGQRIKLR